MERDDRPPVPSPECTALRDAWDILARSQADEAAADLARDRYRTEPMAVLPPDERIRPLLEQGERVLAVRRAARYERRQPATGDLGRRGVPVTAYLTSRRLVLVGSPGLSLDLDAIVEVLLSGERLLLVLHDGEGLALEADRPRLLRVEIAAARAAQSVGGRVAGGQPAAR